MNHILIKNDDKMRIVKYKTLKHWTLYFMYLYDIENYFTYKKNIQERKNIYITKIFKLKTCIKIVYKNWYNPMYRIQYFNNFSKIWLSKAVELWLTT